MCSFIYMDYSQVYINRQTGMKPWTWNETFCDGVLSRTVTVGVDYQEVIVGPPDRYDLSGVPQNILGARGPRCVSVLTDLTPDPET